MKTFSGLENRWKDGSSIMNGKLEMVVDFVDKGYEVKGNEEK